MPSTPPGWYPDQSGSGDLRWWNGVGWTNETMSRGGSQSVQPGPYPGGTQAAGSGVHNAVQLAPYPAASWEGRPPVAPPAEPKTFAQAITTGFRKYVDFTGVASRSEFWFFYLFCILVGFALNLLETYVPDGYAVALVRYVGLVVNLGLLVPTASAAVRRLRDVRYGWGWVFLWLLPFLGWLPLIIMLARRYRPRF